MKNTHLPHVEDMLFITGSPIIPVTYLESMYHFLVGRPEILTTVTIKYDGSPAFVFGKDPENGKFFLGTKSVFSGKVNYCIGDIIRNHKNPALQIKLEDLFDALKDIEWDGVYQGDLLWTENSKTYTDTQFSFCPNTLRYIFPKSIDSEVGAVIHTKYLGDTFKTMRAVFDFDFPVYQTTKYFLFSPEYVPCLDGISEQENSYLRFKLNFLYEICKDYDRERFAVIMAIRNPKFLEIFQKYVNLSVKTAHTITAEGFVEYLRKEFLKHADSLKSQKGKENAISELNAFQASFDYNELIRVIEFYNLVTELKVEMIRKLDTHSNYLIYLPTNVPCGHEGYVMNKFDVPVKFVDRNTFSAANFNNEKAWLLK